MVEDCGIGAAGLLQSVRETAKLLEGPLLVDRLSQFPAGPTRFSQARSKADRLERVPEDVAQQLALSATLLIPGKSTFRPSGQGDRKCREPSYFPHRALAPGGPHQLRDGPYRLQFGDP